MVECVTRTVTSPSPRSTSCIGVHAARQLAAGTAQKNRVVAAHLQSSANTNKLVSQRNTYLGHEANAIRRMHRAASDAIVLLIRRQRWRAAEAAAGRRGTPGVSRPPERRGPHVESQAASVPRDAKNISLGRNFAANLRFLLRRGFECFPTPQSSRQHKVAALLEATMELVVRLNVLAALLSFGFIAAIVFGVV